MSEPRKKTLAMYPSERDKVCDHQHVHYRGSFPCTGPVICSMCGQLWDTMEQAKQGRKEKP